MPLRVAPVPRHVLTSAASPPRGGAAACALAVAILALTMSCGSAIDTPPTEAATPRESARSAPAPQTAAPVQSRESLTITGTEQIAWDQVVPQSPKTPTLRYGIYVDGDFTQLDATCRATADNPRLLSCQSALPKLSRGRHRLELTSAVIGENGVFLESMRSPTMNVFVSTPNATAAASRSGANAPSACVSIIAGPDDQALVADDASIWRVHPARPGEPPSAIVVEKAGGSFLALAMQPPSATTGYLYALRASGADDGSARLALVRYREQGGALAERTVLFDGPTNSRYTRARVRFDADGKIYVGAWVGGGAPPPARPGGIVMRLNADGKVPGDSPDRTGVILRSESIVGFELDPEQRAWVIEETTPARYTLRGIGGGSQRLTNTLPIDTPPSHMTIGRSASGPEMWVAFDDRPPVQIRLRSGRQLTASPSSESAVGFAADLAFMPSGTLLGCSAGDPAKPAGPRVFEVRAGPATGATPRR